MQVLTSNLIAKKKVILRLDIDVPVEKGRITDDFRLKAGMPTLKLCLKHASSVVIIGHMGRPGGKKVPELAVAPVIKWLGSHLSASEAPEGKLHILENLRFEKGEEICDANFAKKLASYGNFYVNESFAAYNRASSTVNLPQLLPHAAGLRFAEEVETILKFRKTPQKPLVSIMGGAKVEDKLPVITSLSKISDAVLVGGKLAQEIGDKDLRLPGNVLVGKLQKDGLDIAQSTTEAFAHIIEHAKTVIWNGPLGKVEDPKCVQTRKIADAIAKVSMSLVGGGDTVAALDKWGMIEKFTFVSTGGGAMLKLLETGTLETIEALQ